MKLPNGPKAPAIVQTLRWIFTPLSYMEECAKRYGDIFTLRVLNNFEPVVLVSNPQALQQILANDTKEFEAPGELNKVFELSLGKNSVITISGMRHQRQRQLMMPAFHGERMRTYGQTIRKVTIDNGEVRPKRRGLVTAPNRSIQMVVKGVRSVQSPKQETVLS